MLWPSIAAMLVAGIFSLSQGYSQPLTTPAKMYKTSPDKDLKRETEPANDSNKVYTLKILSFKTKYPVVSARVNIKSFGDFVTDSHGRVKVNIENKKLPTIFYIEVNAMGYEFSSFEIKLSELKDSRSYTIYIHEQDRMMLKGDISIEGVH